MEKLFLILFSMTVVACGAVQTGSNASNNNNSGVLSEQEMLQYRNCNNNSDCVWAQNGCCDCANGGEDTSINITKQEEFQELFDCTGVSCTMIAPVTPCGSGGAVSCVANTCQYNATIDEY
ncbi:MAG: hypothetical protein V1647_01410 [Pseudomonadota bacterium]